MDKPKDTAILRGCRRLRRYSRAATRPVYRVQKSGQAESSRGNGDSPASVRTVTAGRVSPDQPGRLDADSAPSFAGKAIDNGLQSYPSGAVRSKLTTRYDLLPAAGLRRAAESMARGALRYGERNWEQGMPISEVLNHAIAHVYLYIGGDRTEDHLANASCNLLMAIAYEEKNETR